MTTRVVEPVQLLEYRRRVRDLLPERGIIVSTMRARRIGIRELREGLAGVMRRVRAGETLQVTDRGRPVARLVPIEPSLGSLDHLVSEGKLYPPQTRGRLPPPLDLPSRMKSEEAIEILGDYPP